MRKKTLLIAATGIRSLLIYPALAMGSLILFGIVIQSVDKVYPHRPQQSRKRSAEKIQSQLNSRHLHWQPDGTLHAIQYMDRNCAVFDAKGKKCWEGPYDNNPFKDQYLKFTEKISLRSSRSLAPNFRRDLQKPMNLGKTAVMYVCDPGKPPQSTWQIDSSFSRIHGYGAEGRYCGTLGGDGFVPSKKEARPFGPFRMAINIHAESIAYWVTDRQIFEVDLKKRTVVPLLPGNSRLQVVELGSGVGVFVKTEDGINYILDQKELRTVQLRDAGREKLSGSLAFSKADQQLYLYQKINPDRMDGATCAEVLYRLDKDGLAEEINRVEWTYIEPGPRSSEWFVQLFQMVSPAWPRRIPLEKGYSWPLLRGQDREGFSDVFEAVQQLAGTNVAGWLMFSALLLAAGIRIKGFRGWPTAGWSLFVLFFGFPALLCWLAIAPRVFVRCGTCSKRIHLHDASCRRCNGPNPSEQTLLIQNPTEVIS